jgi:hypothetical protein
MTSVLKPRFLDGKSLTIWCQLRVVRMLWLLEVLLNILSHRFDNNKFVTSLATSFLNFNHIKTITKASEYNQLPEKKKPNWFSCYLVHEVNLRHWSCYVRAIVLFLCTYVSTEQDEKQKKNSIKARMQTQKKKQRKRMKLECWILHLLSCSLLFDPRTYWRQMNDTRASLSSDGEQ